MNIQGTESCTSQSISNAVNLITSFTSSTLRGLSDDSGISAKVLAQSGGHEGDAFREGACVAGERRGVSLVQEVEEA